MESDSSNSEKRSSNDLHPVHDYYIYNETTKLSICKVPGCLHSINGRHSNNLTKHITRKHKELSERIANEVEEYHKKKV